MREGWTYKKLGEVCYIGLGFTHTPTYVDEGVPFLSVKDISGGEIDFSDTKYVSEIEYQNAPKGAKPQKGDILFCRVGTMGKPVVINTDIRFCTFVSLGYLSVLSNQVNNYFVKYWMLSDSFNCQVINNVRGLAIKNLNTGWLKMFDIPVPPLSEQQRIVSELDLLSSIIEKKKAQLKEYDQLAQSIFYDMFGDPVTNEKGWEVKKLGEVCETNSGGTPSKNHPEYYEGGMIPWLRSGEVCQGFIYNTEMFITEEGLKCSSAKMIPVNSVAIAMYGATVGQVGIIKTPLCTNQAICSILPNNHFVPIFLYHFLLSKKNDFLKVAVGGAQPNISQAVIKQTIIGIPPLSLQQSFASKIEAIERQKALVQQSITETETLFNSRMDYYFD